MLEENVVAAAGCSFRLSTDQIIDIARGAGFIPAKRNTKYDILESY
jgi:cyclic dehypoxanthinyl futalosine synthase